MSDRELELTSNQLLIIKTDLSGKFTYCNQQFIELTEYKENELLGQSLQMIYHTDMPSGINHLLWKTLKEKREFTFFFKFKTKTKTKTGAFCWSFANMTPFYSVTGSVTGYTCSFRAPNSAATMMFGMYYEQMKEQEQGQTPEKGAQLSLQLLTDLLSATGDDYEASVFKLQFS